MDHQASPSADIQGMIPPNMVVDMSLVNWAQGIPAEALHSIITQGWIVWAERVPIAAPTKAKIAAAQDNLPPMPCLVLIRIRPAREDEMQPQKPQFKVVKGGKRGK